MKKTAAVLALALALAACGKHDDAANSAAATDVTTLNDESAIYANLSDNAVPADAGALDNAALDNGTGGNAL